MALDPKFDVPKIYRYPTDDWAGTYLIALVSAQELRKNLGEDVVFENWVGRCINEIRLLFVKEGWQVVMKSVGSDGEIIDHFDGRLLNLSHAIEAS
ncbi:MAG: hypothetical protein M2R46_01248 [Verrucomicrobia subdivision 3 bacterium]|nr:hypothetical protein [Limisphaerales bacterium]